MASGVRVRFAPSPTGSPHIGGVRTALFNWLFARHEGGVFILRIEDTDRKRSREASADEFVRAFSWLGIDYDEGPGKDEAGFGPYFQSQRVERHTQAAEELMQAGKAYRCYCTPDELEADREKSRAAGVPPRYSGRCASLSAQDEQRLQSEGRKPAIRMRIPAHGQTVVHDLVRGDVVFENRTMDDFVILKSDGMATYNFACVVDDSDMQISHVIRGEEHLSNTPKQILAYDALGRVVPAFAHVPMILAPDRTKLSKRHGATSLEEFQELGFVQEAILNYLMLLGWTPPSDENEIFGLPAAAQRFALSGIQKNAAVYDIKKLSWINAHYLRSIAPEDLLGRVRPFLDKLGVAATDRDHACRVIGLVRERVTTLVELADAMRSLFEVPRDFDEKGVQKYFVEDGVATRLRELAGRFSQVTEFSAAVAETVLTSYAEELEVARGKLIHPVRLALTGRTVGPGLFELAEVLGRDACVERLQHAAGAIAAGSIGRAR